MPIADDVAGARALITQITADVAKLDAIVKRLEAAYVRVDVLLWLMMSFECTYAKQQLIVL